MVDDNAGMVISTPAAMDRAVDDDDLAVMTENLAGRKVDTFTPNPVTEGVNDANVIVAMIST
jgi:hypothetical protein